MDHPAYAMHSYAEELFAHGRLAAAHGLYRRLLGIYTFAGDRHLRGWVHARLAAIHLAHGQREPALQANVNALRHLDPDRDPELFAGAVHALARLFAEGGRGITHFGRLVKEIRQQRWARGSRAWALIRWLEGEALLARGRVRRAASTLSGARQMLLARKAAGDAAVVTLAQVDACLRSGDPAMARTARLAARDTLDALERLAADSGLVAAFQGYVEALGDGEPVTAAAARVRAALYGPPTAAELVARGG